MGEDMQETDSLIASAVINIYFKEKILMGKEGEGSIEKGDTCTRT